MMKKKILVVDDDPLMLKFMTDLLEKEGHEVVIAEDGFSALEILTSFVPNLMFIDLIMPRIGGDKLCQVVRKMPHLNECQVVFVSGAIAEQEAAEYTKMGASASIAKGPSERMAAHVLGVVNELTSPISDVVPGPIMGIEGVVVRRMTEELLQMNRHLQTVLESMAEGILEVFSEKVVYANAAAISLFGIPQEKLLGVGIRDLFKSIAGPQVEALFAVAPGKSVVIGQDQPVELNGRIVVIRRLPVKGEESTTIVMIRDITQRKRIETQLIHAHKMETIGALVGGIAHEFNNMLMGIHGNVSLMMMDMGPSDPHHERLKKMEEHLEGGGRLTSHLLGYARKGRYDVKPFDLNRAVKDTSNTFGMTRKEIIVHRELAEDLFEVEADQSQIEQVLLNLYLNAADAMEGSGKLILATMNVTDKDMKGKPYDPKPGNYVLLTVTDTGTGMNQETLGRVFDPFFSTKDAGTGVGLGLAAAYGIIKNHGGYIDVESLEVQGTSVSIYVPAVEGDG
ncbi:MAG: response regulator [Deltaproteobacteria bacterium]|nr:response regulator [Deltaproteobacteria bacterium]